jgi:iron complex outermembrane receptor protein
MLAVSYCPTIYAQNQSLQNNESNNVLEVIEVFAQKRAQNTTDVSAAVTVVEGDDITRKQIKDTTQLAELVPNMKVTNNAGEGTPPAFNIRGVGMIDYNTSTISPIAVYNDGIVSGSTNSLSVNLFDIEHVEVLRGPQGTLFGRNTTGGAILIRTKQPENSLGGYLTTSFAQHDSSSVEGAINLPVSEDTALRLAFNIDDYNFSMNNLMADQPDGGLKQQNFRLSFKSVFDDITINAKIFSDDWSGKPKPVASLGVNKVDGSGLCSPSQAGSNVCMDNFGAQIGGDNYWDVSADIGDRTHETDSWGASFDMSWQLNASTTINALSGYKTLERYHSWDSDGPHNVIEGDMGTELTLFSQEINVSIEGENSYWISGLFFLNEELKTDNSFDLFRDFREISALASNAALFLYDNLLENTSIALYSQVDYQLSEKLTLTAGLRYTDETTDYQSTTDLDTVAGYIPSLWSIAGAVEDNEYSGKLALVQKLNKNNSVYYSFSRGYKSGGYNAGYSTNPEQAAASEYAPEKLNAFEVGTKLSFWNNTGSVNIAAFYYDYQDQQVFVSSENSVVPYQVLTNAGDSTIYGAEAEFNWVASNNLVFNLNLGYLPEAEMVIYEELELQGNETRLPFSSEYNVSGAILYDTNIAGKTLTSQLGFDYQSDYYFDQNENPYTEQQGYIVWHGRMSLELNEQLLLSVWGKNISNTEYAELRFDSIAPIGAVTELKGEARQLGVELSYSF